MCFLSICRCTANNISGETACDVLSGENILLELIEGDSGRESPNPITPIQLKKIGISSYESLLPQLGYAYHWVQRICGIDFLTKQVGIISICIYLFFGNI